MPILTFITLDLFNKLPVTVINFSVIGLFFFKETLSKKKMYAIGLILIALFTPFVADAASKKKKEEQYPIEDKKLPKIDEPTIEETRRILALYEEQVKQNAENDLIDTNDEQSDTLVDDLNLDEVDFKFYLFLSYEDRIKLLKKLIIFNIYCKLYTSF